jgi:hypothetical protein
MDYQVFQAEKDLVNIYTIKINRILFLIFFFQMEHQVYQVVEVCFQVLD